MKITKLLRLKSAADYDISCIELLFLLLQNFGHLAIAVSPRLEVEIGGHASLDGCNFQRKRPGPHGVPPAPPCVHRLPCVNNNDI